MSDDTPGVWIGVDVGSVRVGVARCDPAGVLATPVTTLRRDADGGMDLRELATLADELSASGFVVGLPIGLSGRPGPAAQLAQEYASQLRELVSPLPVEMIDERMSTVSAHQALRASGVRGKKQRTVVDQAAAVVILQQWLAQRRA